MLAFEGSDQQSGRLSSTDEFRDANFVVDVRLKSPDSNAVIHAGGVFLIDLRDPTIAGHLEETGRWNRIEAVVEEGKHWVKINSKRVPVESSQRGSSGQLVLQPTGPVDFCNLYAAAE